MADRRRGNILIFLRSFCRTAAVFLIFNCVSGSWFVAAARADAMDDLLRSHGVVVTPDSSAVAPTASTRSLDYPEQLLAASMLDLQQGQLDPALKKINDLLRIEPDFHLAQLMQGDLLLAHAQALHTFGNVAQPSAALNDLRAEAHARLNSLLSPPQAGMLPDVVLELNDTTQHVIVVDTSESRMYVFSNVNGLPHYLADYYVTIGKKGTGKLKEGDERTPLGVYRLTGLKQGKSLTDTYGPMAFPLSFPNDWDAKEGRLGHGIWLHGTWSGTYSRAPLASDGCVVLNNTDLALVAKQIQANSTVVVIADQVHWITPAQLQENRDALVQQINNWQNDWQSLNIDHFLSHYSTQFTANSTSFTPWAENKKRLAPTKKWIKLRLDQVSLFRYPGRPDFYLADFEQYYSSNNLSDQTHKHQYWILQNGQWKILAEDAI